jgi:hypothetical protein
MTAQAARGQLRTDVSERVTGAELTVGVGSGQVSRATC